MYEEAKREEFEFRRMSKAEADQAWKDTLARVQLFTARTESEDDIALVLRIISFLPPDVRNIVLTASSIHIGIPPCTEEEIKRFAEKFSEKALSELRESSSTLVKWPNGRKSIFIHVPHRSGIETIVVFLRQVARLVLGFCGFSAETPEISVDLERRAGELAAILKKYIKDGIEFYEEGQDGCQA